MRGEPPTGPGGTHRWVSPWHRWPGTVERAELRVDAAIDLFDNKTIETVVDGSARPFTDADGVPHTWYGRCMIAIVDERRWIMALRSGVSHISWGQRDAIHLITSTDEGRTWSELDRWFDGSPIRGMPFEDGHTHSEPGLYVTPNGDLILQFWRTGYTSGTRQLRSSDDGRTWRMDADRLCVQGVDGADGDLALGTEDWFVDPDHPADLYLAFQYFHYRSTSGTLLARSRDDGRTFRFVGWIVPPGPELEPAGRATFEPAVEYVGDRTIVAVLRDAAKRDRGEPGVTWQTVSTDMGASFAPPVDVTGRIDGGVAGGMWQRARLYLESNPRFQHGNRLDFSAGEGTLWGFGLHSIGGGYTRKPVVYHSHDRGRSWHGPELLHGPMRPGTDTGYGDIKRRVDGTFVAATYYANRSSTVADVEQYTFGGERAQVMVEAGPDGDGAPRWDSGWRELHDGENRVTVSGLPAERWRLRLALHATETSGWPAISRVTMTPA